MTKFNILYAGDSNSDLLALANYIDEFGASIGLNYVDIDTGSLTAVVRSMVQDFPFDTGADKASPFKKVASFTCYMSALKPIQTTFLPLGAHGQYPNAIVAFHLAIDALQDAELHRKDGTVAVLSNRIEVSPHYWGDTIRAFASLVPHQHCALVSLIYEALAYQQNQKAQYAPKI